MESSENSVVEVEMSVIYVSENDSIVPDTPPANWRRFYTGDDNDSIVQETPPPPEVQTVTVTDSNVSLNQSFGFIPTPTCAVCLSSIVNREPSSTLCGHLFCRACIAKAIETFHSCPICGRPLTEADFHPIYFQ